MNQFFEAIKSLQGSYSGTFMIFWLMLVIACMGVWVFESRSEKKAAKAEVVLFWTIGAAMVCFAAFRPLGIARDDLGYIEFYKAICPVAECGQLIQSPRDWGWYALVGVLKSGFDDVRIMLWLGAVALFIKLFVFFRISRRPLPVLLFFASVYYQVQDLTAWRVSLSLAVFMLAIWLMVRGKTYLGGVVAIACGLFHKQGFVAPLVLVGRFFCSRQPLLISVCLVLLGLVFLGCFPDFELIAAKLGDSFQSGFITNGLDSYIANKANVAYQYAKNAPVVVYPLTLFALWLMLKFDDTSTSLVSIMSGCLVMGCCSLWIFASLLDVQVRFFEFFMMPTVLLAGTRRLKALELSALVLISGVFVTKFNLLAHLLSGS